MSPFRNLCDSCSARLFPLLQFQLCPGDKLVIDLRPRNAIDTSGKRIWRSYLIVAPFLRYLSVISLPTQIPIYRSRTPFCFLSTFSTRWNLVPLDCQRLAGLKSLLTHSPHCCRLPCCCLPARCRYPSPTPPLLPERPCKVRSPN